MLILRVFNESNVTIPQLLLSSASASLVNVRLLIFIVPELFDPHIILPPISISPVIFTSPAAASESSCSETTESVKNAAFVRGILIVKLINV